jgi:putative ABC transport system permease protein
VIKNYLKVALRNIQRHKFFAAINIIWLVIGMTCCLLIFIYVQDELSYDRFHVDHTNMYRLALHGRISGQEIKTSNSCLPVGPAMKESIPGVEEVMRLIPATRGTGMAFRNEDIAFTEDKIFYSDSNFFQFFSFKLLRGNPKTVLNQPNSIVITEAIAKKYFGDQDPIGKSLVVGIQKIACKVTGIAQEAPSNSHFHFNAIISFTTVEKDYFQGWTGNSIQTYIRKTPAARTESINSKLAEIVDMHVGKELQEGLGISLEQFKKQGGIYSYLLYPMTDTHLHSTLADDMEPGSDIVYVYIFSGVGFFILLLACINFMNLSTAQSAGRAKEVGLRKTLGSLRSQMVSQFLSESLVYGFIAVIVSAGVSFLILPQFNQLSGKQLTLQALASPAFIGVATLLIIMVGVLAGSYPAFYLTAFNPAEVLKGKIRTGMKSKGIRSSLVVLQFAVSTFLIIATVVVYQQLGYMKNKNLGLDKHNVLTVTGTRRLGNNQKVFKEKIDSQVGVLSSSYSNNDFPGVDNVTVVREKSEEVDHLVGLYYADWDHQDVLKFELKEGRFFSRDIASDTLAAVINEAAVREYGFQKPLEAELTDFSGNAPQDIRIIGVVKDFNFESLRTSVRPLVIRLADVSRVLMIRYEGDPQRVIAAIESQWKDLAPGEPFEYTFMDQDFDALFRSEMRLRDIFTIFSSLAIFIACLGLFALAAFTTEQRTKEIGVRKAMGASVFNLTVLLSKEFTSLVIIAIIPAVIGGWFVSNWWLEEFTYRTEVGPGLFIGCAALAVIISWITVSYQSIKAARVNPVNSLRYE